MANFDDPKLVIREILNPEDGPPRIFLLTLSQFREVYTEIQKKKPGTPTHILLNGDWAMVQFSRLCNHRIRLVSDQLPRPFSFLSKRAILKDDDFDFASVAVEFFGVKKHLSLWGFISEELSSNFIVILLITIIGYFSFTTIFNGGNGNEALEKVNNAILTASTLYTSIFILFTVSQNAETLKDSYLFRQGLTYRFFRIDRILAGMAVCSILLSILNIVLVNTPRLSFFSVVINLQPPSLILPILTTVNVIILTDCFIALINYYFQRSRYVIEKDLTRELFDDLWNKNNES